MKTNDFDHIAPFYNIISKLVFRKELIKSQTIFLNSIPVNSKICVFGGGQGEFLKTLDTQKNLTIDYIDSSKKMLQIAKSKYQNSHDINFIHSNKLPTQSYDVLIMFFVLDCFTYTNLENILQRSKLILKSKGLWFISDFYIKSNQTLLRKTYINIMYFFFKIVSNIETSNLHDFFNLIEKSGWNISKEAYFSNKKIKSCIFKRET